jgi:hypothetical protein
MSSLELDFASAISLPASADGLLLSASPEFPTMKNGGPEAAHASLSVPLASRWVTLIRAIYSRRGAALSRAAVLQESLESRLQASWDVNGSPEFELKWRRWDMPHGAPICALRASARPIGDKDSSGWPTPTVNDSRNGANRTAMRKPGSKHHDGLTLVDAVRLLPWATPSASDIRHPGSPEHMEKRFAHTRGKRLEQQVAAYLPSGRNVKRFTASTETRGEFLLNPAFTLWLQGYPETWHSSGVRATRSTRG